MAARHQGHRARLSLAARHRPCELGGHRRPRRSGGQGHHHPGVDPHRRLHRAAGPPQAAARRVRRSVPRVLGSWRGWSDAAGKTGLTRSRGRRTASTMRTSRSWPNTSTWVRAWVRPAPLWCSRPLTRKVTVPPSPRTSWQTRSWRLPRPPDAALDRDRCATAGVLRPASERCGRSAISERGANAAGILGEGRTDRSALDEVHFATMGRRLDQWAATRSEIDLR